MKAPLILAKRCAGLVRSGPDKRIEEKAMWRLPRKVQTTIPCRHCKTPLMAERSCRKVTLSCHKCRTMVDIDGYIDQMDEILEEFLAQVPCDRI